MLNYEQKSYQLPNPDLFHHRSSSTSDHDSVSCSGWAGKLTFNAGAYAKAAMEVPFMKRQWEVVLRIEGGLRLWNTVHHASMPTIRTPSTAWSQACTIRLIRKSKSMASPS